MELSAALVEWVEQVTGGRVASAQRTFGGGSRFTWLVDVVGNSGADAGDVMAVPLVLRVESGEGAFAGTVLTLQREAVVYTALQGLPARIPTLHGIAPDGAALLMARAPGTSDFHRLSAVDASSALEDFVDVLAALHRIPVVTLSLPGFAIPMSAAEHALNELDVWEQMAAQRCPDLDPQIAYAISWLRTHAPATVARTCLVQGDTGPGNFVVDAGKVSAVIDWEFAHVGDAIDDIAWFIFRAAGRDVTATPEQIESLLRRYEAAAGFAIDSSSLAYYRVFVQLHCAVTTAMTIAHGGGAMGLAGYRVAHSRFVRQCLQAVADAIGVDVDQPEMPCPTATPRTALFDDALHELADGLIPALRGEAKLRARSAQTLLTHLRARDMVGAALERSNAMDAAILGVESNDQAQMRAVAASAGGCGDRDVLACLLRRAIRDEWLWSGAFNRVDGDVGAKR